jgi:hypothetical protein
MFCASGLVFGSTESVGSRFHVLRARTCFHRYKGRRVPFSYFALPASFSAVPMVSGPVFTLCSPGLVFGGKGGIGSYFRVLRARTHFRRFRGRRVPFSCFARPDSFSAVPSASGHVFMFCALGLVYGGTNGVGSLFHVLRTRNRFRRYRGRRVQFSCFALPYPFSAVPRASSPVFMFCAPGLVFGGSGGVGSRFQVLCAWTRFRRYRGRRVSFSRFALLDTFSTVSRASTPVFMFCAPGLVFCGTEGVESHFHVLCF